MNAPVNYILQLADTALILSHRNSEWCGHGPVLEQDIAITNISLDLLGQARYLYQHAASLINETNPEALATEDSLASFRNEREFRNLLICELPRGDWALTCLRQFFVSAYHQSLYSRLEKSKDTQLAAIASKSLKEVKYHLKWSAEWVVRMGNGTEESLHRIKEALEQLWPYTGEMLLPSEQEESAAANGTGTDPKEIRKEWFKMIQEVFEEAGLTVPENVFMQTGGKKGVHTENLGYILTELQYMQRAFPGSEW
jgi:ring-1,2-phenylacetyl-CoA epoxidase subunit PaaC